MQVVKIAVVSATLFVFAAGSLPAQTIMPVRYLLRRQQQDDNAMVKSIMDEIYVAGGNNNAAAAPTPSAGDIATSPIPTVYPNSSPSQTADGNSTAGHADKITVAGVDPVPTGNPTVASIMKQIAVSGVNNNSAAAPTPSAGNVTTSPIPTAYPNPSPSQTADSNNGADGVDPVPTGDPDVASIMKQIAVIGQSNNGGAPNTTQSKQGNTLSLSSKPTQVPTPAGPTHPAPASSVSGSGSSLNGDAASIMDQIKVIGSGNASGNTGAAPSPTASPTPTKPSNSYPEPSGNVSTSPNPTKAVPSVTQLQPNPDEQSQINLANSQIASIINSLIKNNPDIAQFISVPSISVLSQPVDNVDSNDTQGPNASPAPTDSSGSGSGGHLTVDPVPRTNPTVASLLDRVAVPGNSNHTPTELGSTPTSQPTTSASGLPSPPSGFSTISNEAGLLSLIAITGYNTVPTSSAPTPSPSSPLSSPWYEVSTGSNTSSSANLTARPVTADSQS